MGVELGERDEEGCGVVIHLVQRVASQTAQRPEEVTAEPGLGSAVGVRPS